MAISRIRRSNTTSIVVGERTPVTTVLTTTLIRSMQQVSTNPDVTPLSYEFHFGISTFTHDSSGVLYTEIPRPLNLPLVDATSQKLERCSFEFLIAVPYDSIGASVDSHITLLQDFANEDKAVQFTNVHSALSTKTWNIDSITFQITRVNESGQATAATCNMSLVESIARNDRFIQLPKFTYSIPRGSGLSTPGSSSTPPVNGTGNISQIESLGRGGLVVVTTATAHGLKSGQFVIIAFDAFLIPSNVIALATPQKPYEITVNALTPTKFTYIKDAPLASFVAPYNVAAGKATYTSTQAVVKQQVLVPVVADRVDNPYVAPSTKGATDKLAIIGSTPVKPNATFDPFDLQTSAIRTQISTYLYSLKVDYQSSNQKLYEENIGDTNSVSYKKAVSYLTTISSQGRDVTTVPLDEIVRNIG